MRTAGEKVDAALRPPYPEPKREAYARALYIAAVLWTSIAAIIVDRVASAAMRLF